MRMQDRYLFRGKRIDNGEWVIGNRIDDGVTGQVFIHTVGNSVNESDKVGEEGCLQFVAFEVAPATICQCTGLKDKNGNLIWENDIVKINNSEVNTLITFRDFEIICTIPREKYYKHRLEHTTEYDVVGNVFDNPELLEE
jgi:uncharacterized phage protein (TIGR01671 family)